MVRFIAKEGVITILHGSNQSVIEPDLSMCVNNGDFGKYTFYTCTDESLALDRAQKKSKYGNYGKATVTEYSCNTAGLVIQRYDKPDIDWILAIADGRDGTSPPHADIVIGPIADGIDINLALQKFFFKRRKKEANLGLFERGLHSQEYKDAFKDELNELLYEIKTVGSNMQYAFCTPRAIEALRTEGYRVYDNKNNIVKTFSLSKRSDDDTPSNIQPQKILIHKKTRLTVRKPKTKEITHER